MGGGAPSREHALHSVAQVAVVTANRPPPTSGGIIMANLLSQALNTDNKWEPIFSVVSTENIFETDRL